MYCDIFVALLETGMQGSAGGETTACGVPAGIGRRSGCCRLCPGRPVCAGAVCGCPGVRFSACGRLPGRWTGAESGGGVSAVAGCSRHVRKNRQRISLFGEIRCPVCVAMPAPPVRHRGCYGRITSWSSPCRRDGRRSRNATWHSPRRRRTARLPRPGRPS